MKNKYKSNSWFKFREKIIESDNMACVKCGKTRSSGAILQVHHKEYIQGKAIWEYPPELCETLCKGCHAAEHGIIPPKDGWLYLGEHDLGSVDGRCELCHTEIRYVCFVQHLRWGVMEVGSNCCDSLTGETTASEKQKDTQKYNSRLKTFLNSPKWTKTLTNCYSIHHHEYHLLISQKDNFFYTRVNSTDGKSRYSTLEAAQVKFFELYETGELEKFFKSKK